MAFRFAVCFLGEKYVMTLFNVLTFADQGTINYCFFFVKHIRFGRRFSNIKLKIFEFHEDFDYRLNGSTNYWDLCNCFDIM